MTKPRKLTQIIEARPAADGDGVKIKRIGGAHLNTVLDPFLMLDEIRSDDSVDYIGGFPSHPHRGFETITYMLDGLMRHRDHMGNEGLLGPGGVQWMTAGRGVIHSEIPEQQEGLLHGFQLWLNLPAESKMQSASYQDFDSAKLPVLECDSGIAVKVIAGKMRENEREVTGPIVREKTWPSLLDVTIPAGETFIWCAPENHTVLVYVFAGELQGLEAGHMGVFTQGEALILRGVAQTRALILAGMPLREPIKQYGPFVMNTVDEIEQAIHDYNRGALV